MPNFFYYDANGQKFGPVNDVQLKSLATQGVINPQTPLETDSGHRGQAGQIPGLFATPAPANPFAATPQPVPHNAAGQHVPVNLPSNPLPMILLVGLLIVGTICLGVGLHACHWGYSRYTPFEKNSKGNYVLTLPNGTKAVMTKAGSDNINRPSRDAFKIATVFFVIAVGCYGGSYVVFTRVVKRKQE